MAIALPRGSGLTCGFKNGVLLGAHVLGVTLSPAYSA